MVRKSWSNPIADSDRFYGYDTNLVKRYDKREYKPFYRANDVVKTGERSVDPENRID